MYIDDPYVFKGSKDTLTPPTYFQGVKTPSTPGIYALLVGLLHTMKTGNTLKMMGTEAVKNVGTKFGSITCCR